MAPREEVEQQTLSIINCLFDDDDDKPFRQGGDIEADGTDDSFDPVVIADKLKQVADKLEADAVFQAAVTELKQAVADQAVAKAFSSGVDAVCQAWVSQAAEVAPEMQLITASVALGLYIKGKSPELVFKVKRAMSTFLNARVGGWVAEKGGWSNVADV